VEQHPDSSLVLPGAPKGRLPELLREAIRTRNYSRRTEKTYWFWIRWFILFNGWCNREERTRQSDTAMPKIAERILSTDTSRSIMVPDLFALGVYFALCG